MDIKVVSEGPFFTLKNRPIKDAGADWINDLLKEGEAKVEQQLFPSHGVNTGRYKSSIHQKFVRSSPNVIGWGKLIGGDAGGYPNLFIIGAWLEGASRAGTPTRFRGYGMFRKATQHLRRIANQMAGKHYKKAVQRLT